MRDVGFWILDFGCWILDSAGDSGWVMREAGCGMLVFGCWILDSAADSGWGMGDGRGRAEDGDSLTVGGAKFTVGASL